MNAAARSDAVVTGRWNTFGCKEYKNQRANRMTAGRGNGIELDGTDQGKANTLVKVEATGPVNSSEADDWM